MTRHHIAVDDLSGWWLKADACTDVTCPQAHADADDFIPPPSFVKPNRVTSPDYKLLQSNKTNTRNYYAEHGGVYGCWSCKRTDRQLKKLGRNRENLTIYGCPEHSR